MTHLAITSCLREQDRENASARRLLDFPGIVQARSLSVLVPTEPKYRADRDSTLGERYTRARSEHAG